MPFHHILLPTDCTDADVETVQQALALAAHEHAPVLLLHVLPSLAVTGSDETVLARAEHRLHTMARHAEIPVQTLVLWGTPGVEICRVATDHQCDLIAMRTHGYTGVVLDHFGSVADYVIRHAPCSVLILRTARAGTGQAPA